MQDQFGATEKEESSSEMNVAMCAINLVDAANKKKSVKQAVRSGQMQILPATNKNLQSLHVAIIQQAILDAKCLSLAIEQEIKHYGAVSDVVRGDRNRMLFELQSSHFEGICNLAGFNYESTVEHILNLIDSIVKWKSIQIVDMTAHIKANVVPLTSRWKQTFLATSAGEAKRKADARMGRLRKRLGPELIDAKLHAHQKKVFSRLRSSIIKRHIERLLNYEPQSMYGKYGDSLED